MKTKLLILAAAPLIAFAGGNPAGTSVGFRPLDELGNGTYNNATGGLYSGGSNVIPPAHFAAGQFLAQQIQPRDTNGNPNATGKIGVVCLGMSNSSFIFDTMIELLLGQTATNVVLVNAAVGGFDVADWANPTNSIWGSTVAKVTAKGLTPAQVQVVLQYHSMANSKYPPQPWPATPQDVQTFMEQTMRNLPAIFTNAKLCFWSSREYAGYTTTMNNPEPYAYQSGFAVKWMIEKQINGDATLNYNPTNGPVRSPWMAWGPYVWGDGVMPRADGSFWEIRDFNADGVHPSVRGRTKAAAAWARFLLTNALTSPWLRIAGNLPPMVKIIGPTANVPVEAGGRVAIEAHATDLDGTVSRVDFFQGNTLIGSDSNAPFSLLWTGFAAGNYTVKAVAFDQLGASTTIFPVALVLANATSTSGSTTVVMDNFESGDFVGGAGWPQQGWLVGGAAAVTTTLAPPEGTFQAQLPTGAAITRDVNFSVGADATLSFKWRGLIPAGYSFLVESLGTNTQTIFSQSNVTVSSALTQTNLLTPFVPGTNFSLRFRVTGPGTAASILLDDIRITIPGGASPVPPVLTTRFISPSQLHVVGNTTIHRTYSIEYSPDLQNWTPVDHTTAIEDSTFLYPATATGSAGFHRASTVFPP